MIYLTAEDLLHIAKRATGEPVQVRDMGLVEAAAARSRASAFGEDAYGTLELKAAALAQSIARHHALVDGNKRLTLGALLAFLGINGRRLRMTNDEAYDFIVGIATGQLDVDEIAERLRQSTAAW